MEMELGSQLWAGLGETECSYLPPQMAIHLLEKGHQLLNDQFL